MAACLAERSAARQVSKPKVKFAATEVVIAPPVKAATVATATADEAACIGEGAWLLFLERGRVQWETSAEIMFGLCSCLGLLDVDGGLRMALSRLGWREFGLPPPLKEGRWWRKEA